MWPPLRAIGESTTVHSVQSSQQHGSTGESEPQVTRSIHGDEDVDMEGIPEKGSNNPSIPDGNNLRARIADISHYT